MHFLRFFSKIYLLDHSDSSFLSDSSDSSSQDEGDEAEREECKGEEQKTMVLKVRLVLIRRNFLFKYNLWLLNFLWFYTVFFLDKQGIWWQRLWWVTASHGSNILYKTGDARKWIKSWVTLRDELARSMDASPGKLFFKK